MRFGPWYPLAAAGDHAPAAEGVLQLRVAEGLVEYPTGKSAMIAYRHAADVRAAALALAQAVAPAHPGDLLCRHLIEFDPATDLAAFCAKLRSEFVRRFGRAPIHDLPDP